MTTRIVNASNRAFTRQQYLNNECTHSEYYAQYVNEWTRQTVKRIFGVAKLKEAFLANERFNSIPLAKWDNAAGLITTTNGLMKQNGDNLTLAGQVCILKEAARQVLETIS